MELRWHLHVSFIRYLYRRQYVAPVFPLLSETCRIFLYFWHNHFSVIIKTRLNHFSPFSSSMFPSRSLPLQTRTPLKWAWSLRLWIVKTPTLSAQLQWVRCVASRCWSPLMVGRGHLTTIADLTHVTSSLLAGATSLETTFSHLAPKVWT